MFKLLSQTVFASSGKKRKAGDDIARGSVHTLWGVHPIATHSQQDYLKVHEARPAREHQPGKRKTS